MPMDLYHAISLRLICPQRSGTYHWFVYCTTSSSAQASVSWQNMTPSTDHAVKQDCESKS